jgi:hypothetical protein
MVLSSTKGECSKIGSKLALLPFGIANSHPNVSLVATKRMLLKGDFGF